MDFKIIIQQQGEPDQQADVKLEEKELSVIRAYLMEFNRLSNSKTLQQGLPCKMRIHFNKETGMNVSGEWPCDDDFAILLHRLRPFFLQKEPASHTKITAILGKRLPHAVFREYMREQHDFWNGGAFKTYFPIIINGSRINPEKIFTAWLNAHEYHRDEDRTNDLHDISQHLFPGLLQTIITTCTLERLRAVKNTALLLRLLLGEISELIFEPYTLVRE